VIHVLDSVIIPPEDIVAIASGNDDFENLVAAVSAAELVETLQGEGPFTVFAPNDAAFDALGDTLTDLLLPENKDALAGILTYHVVSGLVGPLDLADGDLVETVNGASVAISIEGGSVKVNDAEIIATNVVADNGVIHVLDSVIIPPEDIVAIASGNDDFENLVAAVSAAELVETLQGEGPFTVFAPTDAAFDALGDTLTDLLLPENKDTLAGILTYHVISGLVGPLDLVNGALVETVNGAPVSISLADGIAKINDAEIIATNVVADNGVIHVLDSVILPPTDDIVATAINTDGEFTKLEAALGAADLVSALQAEGPFTVFAPTDAAFDALGDTLTDLLLPENKDQLVDILLYHVVSGSVGAADLADGASVETLLEGNSVTFDLSGETPMVDDANIVLTNIITTNGIIHVIDKVIIPQS
jgi:transforming growth factor-beta-induced protein